MLYVGGKIKTLYDQNNGIGVIYGIVDNKRAGQGEPDCNETVTCYWQRLDTSLIVS